MKTMIGIGIVAAAMLASPVARAGDASFESSVFYDTRDEAATDRATPAGAEEQSSAPHEEEATDPAASGTGSAGRGSESDASEAHRAQNVDETPEPSRWEYPQEEASGG